MKNLKIDDDLNQIVSKTINNIPSSPFEDELPTKLLIISSTNFSKIWTIKYKSEWYKF